VSLYSLGAEIEVSPYNLVVLPSYNIPFSFFSSFANSFWLCALEGLVKVFSEVISKRIDVNETLSSIFQGCSKTRKSTDSSE